MILSQSQTDLVVIPVVKRLQKYRKGYCKAHSKAIPLLVQWHH